LGSRGLSPCTAFEEGCSVPSPPMSGLEQSPRWNSAFRIHSPLHQTLSSKLSNTLEETMLRALVTLVAFAAAIIAATGTVAHAQCLGMSCYGSGPTDTTIEDPTTMRLPGTTVPMSLSDRATTRGTVVWIALAGATLCGTGSANPRGDI